MLGKHSLIYFLGRGLPGIINFLAISIYTRLLLPAEYGKYALIIAAINMLMTILYQWLRVVLLRYLPSSKEKDESRILYATIGTGFIAACLISLVFVIICYFCNLISDIPLSLTVLGLILLWIQSFFEIGLDCFRSNLEAKKYSVANLLKSLLAILIGTILAYIGLGALGLIVGLLSSSILIILIYFREILYDIFFFLKNFDKNTFKKHLIYGLPLTASYAMNYVTNTSDRFFVKHYLGVAQTGIYSVGYDLARQTLLVIMMSISLASYPIVVKAYEKEGPVAANVYLSSNLVLLVAISFPSAIGLGILSLPISKILIGHLYSKEVASIIPLISIGAFINGLRSFYIDQSYQLSHKTKLQMYSVAVAASVNFLLNFILIPRIGIMGAVYSSIICYALDFFVSAFISRSAYRLPVPWKEIFKITACTAIMAVTLFFLRDRISNFYYLFLVITLGAISYAVPIVILKVFNFKVLFSRFK